jgi:general secretion pathway protein D
MVRLAISLEITSLAGTSSDRPTTLKRTIDTTAICKDGQTLVLGGLIDDTESTSHYKVPCLGDIPGFGFLFGTKANSFDKGNLYIFLTPKVIQSPEESYKISSDKRNAIEKARGNSIDLNPRKQELPPLEELLMPAPKSDLESDRNANIPQIEPAAAYDDSRQDAGRIDDGDKADTMATESTGGVQGFTLQVASVKQPEIANELLEALTEKGYAAYIVRSEIGDTTWYRVRTGYFADQQVATPVIERLKADQYDPILIKL